MEHGGFSKLEGFIFDLQRHANTPWPVSGEIYRLISTDGSGSVLSQDDDPDKVYDADIEMEPYNLSNHGALGTDIYYLKCENGSLTIKKSNNNELDPISADETSVFSNSTFSLWAYEPHDFDFNGLIAKVNLGGIEPESTVSNVKAGSTIAYNNITGTEASLTLVDKTFNLVFHEQNPQHSGLTFKIDENNESNFIISGLAKYARITVPTGITLNAYNHSFSSGSTVIHTCTYRDDGDIYDAVYYDTGGSVTLTGVSNPSISFSKNGWLVNTISVGNAGTGDATDDNTATVSIEDGLAAGITNMAANTKVEKVEYEEWYPLGYKKITYTSADNANDITKTVTYSYNDAVVTSNATIDENADILGATYAGVALTNIGSLEADATYYYNLNGDEVSTDAVTELNFSGYNYYLKIQYTAAGNNYNASVVYNYNNSIVDYDYSEPITIPFAVARTLQLGNTMVNSHTNITGAISGTTVITGDAFGEYNDVTVNGVVFMSGAKDGAKAPLTIAGAANNTATLTNGTVKVTPVHGVTLTKSGKAVSVTGTNAEITVKVDNNKDTSNADYVDITGMAVGNSVTYGNVTYEALTSSIVSATEGATTKYYTVNNLSETDLVGGLTAEVSVTELWKSLAANNVYVKQYFTAAGAPTTYGAENVAFIVEAVYSDYPAYDFTITVTKPVNAGILDLYSDFGSYNVNSVTVTDSSGSGTVYKLSATETVTSTGGFRFGGFKTAVTLGNLTVTAIDSNIAYDVSSSNTSVTFPKGKTLNNTSIGIAGTNTSVAITETNADVAGNQDTIVYSTGNITGLDASGTAVYTGLISGQVIAVNNASFNMSGNDLTIKMNSDGTEVGVNAGSLVLNDTFVNAKGFKSTSESGDFVIYNGNGTDYGWVSATFTDGMASVTNLTQGDRVTIKKGGSDSDKIVYTRIGRYVIQQEVTVTESEATRTYTTYAVTDTIGNANTLALTNTALTAGGNVTYAGETTGITVDSGTVANSWYNAAGFSIYQPKTSMAAVTVQKSNGTYNVDVVSGVTITDGITINGVKAAVTDAEGATVYTLDSADGDPTIKGTGFTVASNGSVSSTSGTATIDLISGTITATSALNVVTGGHTIGVTSTSDEVSISDAGVIGALTAGEEFTVTPDGGSAASYFVVAQETENGVYVVNKATKAAYAVATDGTWNAADPGASIGTFEYVAVTAQDDSMVTLVVPSTSMTKGKVIFHDSENSARVYAVMTVATDESEPHAKTYTLVISAENKVIFKNVNGELITGNYTFSVDGKSTAVLTSTNEGDSLTASLAGVKLNVGGTEYTAGTANTEIQYNGTNAVLIAGSVALDNGESIEVSGRGTITNDGSSAIGVDTDGVVYSVDSDGSFGSLTGGAAFTTQDDTYTVKYTIKSNGNKVTVVQTTEASGKKTRVYDVPSDSSISVTMASNKGAFDTGTSVDTAQTGELSGVVWDSGVESAIDAVREIGTIKYFDAMGIEIDDPDERANAAIVIDGTKTPKTVTISKAVDASLPAIDLTGANTAVSDSVGTCSFDINGSVVSGKSFSINNNIITSAADTIKVVSGPVILSVANAKVDISGGLNTDTVTFTDTTKTSGAVIKTRAGEITVTETGTGTATVIDQMGNVSGLDGDVAITGVPSGQTVTTTGDGKATINGKSYTLSNSSGITYTAATSGISAISGLANGTALKLEGKFYDGSLTDSDLELNFTGISSVDGVTFTKNGASYNVGFDSKGEAFTVGSVTYKLDSDNGSITVDSATGTVTGITEGTKVTIDDTANGTTTYEVKDGILVIKDGMGSTLTYKRVDSSTPFGVAYDSTDGTTTVVPGTYSTDVTEQIAATGLQVGGTNVTTITNGMYVDKDGKATTDSNKAVAAIKISDNGEEVRYESMTDRAQQIDVNAGTAAANKEWDITTGNGGDVINLASTKDSIVKAGDGRNRVNIASSGDTTVNTGIGNDNINVTGSGDALVETGGGNNRIAHTGTGTATLRGGSGNDTISSSNENDSIELGDGENTLKMTNGVTNTISDYKYGSDRLSLASTKGKLSMVEIKVKEDGTISYGTDNGAVKAGDDGQSFYAASLVDADGMNRVNVGWTGEDGGMIDATSLTEKVLLLGNSKAAKDTLMGGKGADTLKAGSGTSSLWGGSGNDILISSSENSNEIFFLTGDGRDTVQGFTTYSSDTSDTADVLNFFGNSITGVEMTDKGLKLHNGDSNMLVTSSYDENTMFRWKDGEAEGIAKVGKNDSANSMNYDASVTNYIGGKGIDSVKLGSDDGAVNVWMDGSNGSASYDSIEILDASSSKSDATLAGGLGKETIVGSRGLSSLWGGMGSSADVLIGNGQTDFFYGLGNGNDSISGHRGDTVDLFDMKLSDLTSAVIDTANRRVIFTTTAGDKVTVSGGVESFKIEGHTYTTSYSSSNDWN